MNPPRVRNHRGREIDAENNGAPICGRRSHITGAAGNVDDFDPSLGTYRIQQRLNSLRGQANEGLMVLLGDGFPTSVFELVESLRVNHAERFLRAIRDEVSGSGEIDRKGQLQNGLRHFLEQSAEALYGLSHVKTLLDRPDTRGNRMNDGYLQVFFQ